MLNSPESQGEAVEMPGDVALEEPQSFSERTGSIAHDLNNMLGSMLGYGHLVLQDMAVDDPSRAFLEEVLKAGAEAAQLVAELLDNARRELGCPARSGLSKAA
jgi:signal transduction histidine kinase